LKFKLCSSAFAEPADRYWCDREMGAVCEVGKETNEEMNDRNLTIIRLDRQEVFASGSLSIR